MTARTCIPPELRADAAAAEQRKEAALDRLLSKLEGTPPRGDDMERALGALIDADKRVVDMMKRRAER